MDSCLLVSTAAISGIHWKRELEKDGLDYLSLSYILGDKANHQRTRILIVSGTHGHLNKTILTQNKEFFIQHCGNDGSHFYEEDCDYLGVDPSPKPDPSPQTVSPNAEKFALMKRLKAKVDKMSFNIVNLNHFHKDHRGFCEYVNTFNPTVIILSFCSSKHSDVYDFLVSDAITAKMTIRRDLVRITGDTLAELDSI